MENSALKTNREKKSATVLIVVFLFFIISGIHAQQKQSVTGKVIDEKNGQPVPFASVVLFNESDNALAPNVGTMSSENGIFSLSPVHQGRFRLKISSVGYAPATTNVEVSNLDITDAGEIFLHDSTLLIGETTVIGQRAGGNSESGKTVYYINKKIIDASGTGTDVLKYIPGIQVDLKQNISLEGSTNILVYVDGTERSRSYLSQLRPDQIDKVEIINSPSSVYDGSVSGVINIMLKKVKNAGVSGQVYAEVPTSGSEIFLFPTAGISYGFNKVNLFASFNGEINYENIDESKFREIYGEPFTGISSVESVRQRNLSQRFHYGVDYFFNEKSQMNYYGFYNPYSYEQNGNVKVQFSGNENSEWDALRTENDRNTGILNSVFFKHVFGKPGSEISFDVTHFYQNSENSTLYNSDTVSLVNLQNPKQNTFSAKTDLMLPVTEKWNLSAGVKVKYQKMKDNSFDEVYSSNEGIYAVYGMAGFKQDNTQFTLGLRTEYSQSDIKNSIQKSVFALLPYFTFNYKINSRQNLKATFNRSAGNPSIYQLDPWTFYENQYSVSHGNPLLDPEFRNNLNVEHSLQVKSSYFSTRLFYNRTTDVINNLTFINDDGIFETQLQNLGKIAQYGAQFSGTIKAGFFSFNPVIRIYGLNTTGNQLARQYGIDNRQQLVFEPSFTSILSLKKDFTLSVIFQYSTPKNNIQDNYYCDALYFVSLDKTIKNRLKVGIVSALDFKRNFVYRGSEIKANDFYSLYEGNLKLSAFPAWFRISYQFHSGTNREKIERSNEEIDQRQKKGF